MISICLVFPLPKQLVIDNTLPCIHIAFTRAPEGAGEAPLILTCSFLMANMVLDLTLNLVMANMVLDLTLNLE